MKSKSKFTIVLSLATVLVLNSSCSRKPELVQSKATKFLMGTIVDITVLDTSETAANDAIEAAFAEIGRIADIFYEGNPESPIYAFNHRLGNQLVMSSEVLGLVQRSIDISGKTEGAFDITIGALLPLYQFNGDSLVPPDEKAIQKSLPNVNFRMLTVDMNNNLLICENKNVQIGTGAVAKGYAVDRAIDILKLKGVKGAIVNAGGDLRTLPRSDGRLWRLGIQHPRQHDEILGVLEISEGSVTTSGDYEKFFMYNGKRIHHILNPKTGLPADSCQSVTIVAQTTELADALATAMFVLGESKGKEIIRQFPAVEAMWVRADGQRFETPGFAKYYTRQ